MTVFLCYLHNCRGISLLYRKLGELNVYLSMYILIASKVCQRFGAGIKLSTGEIVHRGLRYELIPVSMLISAAVPFCLLLKGVELLI